MKLVLFDIDQTIIHSGGAGEKALTHAVHALFGQEADLAGIEIAGRTDVGIAHQVFRRHGIEPDDAEAARFLQSYLRHLREELQVMPGRLMPGFPQILERLSTMPSVGLGLLTGNIRAGAELKLTRYGVWHYFSFGAFSDDSPDRNRLGPFALARAKELYGREFTGADTWVLGDTPHDINCAKAFAARSAGVATGNFSHAQLEACGPDFVFEDLSATDAVIESLGLDRAS